MATITWPTSLRTGPVDYGIQFDVQMSVYRNGRITTYGLPGARWVAAITFESELENMQRPTIEALIVSLEGGANRLSMHHLARPAPNGTLRGSPTLSAAVAAGAKSLPMNNCNGGLKAGDLIGINGQTVMVMTTVNPVSSAMTVDITPALRAGYNAGQPIVWDKPPMLWIPRESLAGPFPYKQNNVRPGFSIELVEAY